MPTVFRNRLHKSMCCNAQDQGCPVAFGCRKKCEHQKYSAQSIAIGKFSTVQVLRGKCISQVNHTMRGDNRDVKARSTILFTRVVLNRGTGRENNQHARRPVR